MPSERDETNRDRLISIIAEQLGVTREKVADRMPDLDGIAIDSLDVAGLALDIKEEFGDDGTLP
ncbi:MAG: hypothetical protein H8E66_20650 [Planctomycetes bacterium]|nr:hypothetical protein [Planctomycetota bacterium]